jgi:hypothetical protein
MPPYEVRRFIASFGSVQRVQSGNELPHSKEFPTVHSSQKMVAIRALILYALEAAAIFLTSPRFHSQD